MSFAPLSTPGAIAFAPHDGVSRQKTGVSRKPHGYGIRADASGANPPFLARIPEVRPGRWLAGRERHDSDGDALPAAVLADEEPFYTLVSRSPRRAPEERP
jgi:hypothetical protein